MDHSTNILEWIENAKPRWREDPQPNLSNYLAFKFPAPKRSDAHAHNSTQPKQKSAKFISSVRKVKLSVENWIRTPNSTMSESEDTAGIEGLSPEVLTTVLAALEASDTALLNCEQVSKKWRDVILSSPIYRYGIHHRMKMPIR